MIILDHICFFDVSNMIFQTDQYRACVFSNLGVENQKWLCYCAARSRVAGERRRHIQWADAITLTAQTAAT
jgi:hypothetical protein